MTFKSPIYRTYHSTLPIYLSYHCTIPYNCHIQYYITVYSTNYSTCQTSDCPSALRAG